MIFLFFCVTIPLRDLGAVLTEVPCTEMEIKMKRKFLTIPLVMAAVLGMTGCGNVIPDMSADEMQAIGEYAAITLMKYDVHHRSRLVDLELVAQAEAEAKAKAEAEALAQAEAAAKEQEESGMRPTDNTPVVGSEGIVTAPSVTMEEILNLPEGVSITYRETEICQSYPEGSENFFTLSSTEGTQLFVLYFELHNESGHDQYIDLLSQGMNLRVTVNESYTRRALTTMLLNDITSYMDTLAAGARVEVVAVVEVENSIANNVSSIKLELKDGTNTYTDQLL